MSNIININKINVGYEKKVVVEDLSLEGIRGQMICLLGPNGAGKSTVIRTITGLLSPVEGIVYIFGSNISDVKKSELAKTMAIVLTDNSDLGLLTVKEIVSMGRYPHTNHFGKLMEHDEIKVDEALEYVSASNLKDRYYSNLSDGEKQKVMIARALAQEPQILVLDEPTSHLDVRHKVEVVSILNKLCLEKNMTVILSLHDIDLAIKGCRKILMIQDGKVISQGSPEDVVKNGTIQDLYNIKGAKYNELMGSIEFCNHKEPSVFITGGNGTGVNIYRAVSRMGIGMCCGILHSNDIDMHIGKSLTCNVIEESSFNEISDHAYEQAMSEIERVEYVIDSGFPIGRDNRRNLDLIFKAIEMGKKVVTIGDKNSSLSRYGENVDNIKYFRSISEMLDHINE